MGAFWTDSMQIVGHLGEFIGYKAGLALTREELGEHLIDTPRLRDIVLDEENRWVHIRSEDYQEAATGLLYQVGNLATQHPLLPVMTVHRQFENDPIHSNILGGVIDRYIELLNDQLGNRSEDTPLDLEQPVENIHTEFGAPGVNIAIEMINAMSLQQHISPFSYGRWVDWDDTAQLRDLFQSESLETKYGTYFDQRFIDYLARNFQRIDDINWRKFEGLTGEFFEQAGFQVEMGPGRADGGIDVRVWAPAEDTTKPPLILVQCKRQREKVSQVVVKALWADIANEDARSGLIVTTSTLAPSADTVRKARKYRIAAAERPTLQRWVEQLRSPGYGTFLA